MGRFGEVEVGVGLGGTLVGLMLCFHWCKGAAEFHWGVRRIMMNVALVYSV